MGDFTTAFWGMTINNYDETDLALVKQGYPDYIRQIVYTLEKGDETGTPHIQAYIKLNRQQRLSYVKKLFPRGSFKALTNDEYKLNAQRYAQKLDGTAQSPATITNNPFPDAVNELISVVEGAYKWYANDREWHELTKQDWDRMLHMEQHVRVREKPHLAKFYVSSQYKTIVKEYLFSIVEHVMRQSKIVENSGHTHTHTHRENLFSQSVNIPIDAAEGSQEDSSQCSEGSEEDSEGEDYEDGSGETDEGYSEGSGTESDSQDIWERG